jgi:methylthioribose-1-phosphate isomerase
MLSPVSWYSNQVRILDQRLLPEEEKWLLLSSVEEVAEAIRTLAVRGAPAIGIAAAMGCALAAMLCSSEDSLAVVRAVKEASATLEKTRPTAVNLFWALARMCKKADELKEKSPEEIKKALIIEANAIRREDIAACRSIGRFGARLLPQNAAVLTHCNAGALATGGFGTALGVIRSAVEAGKKISVFADETRPLLQGGRLTTWELMRDGIDVTLICDNMAGTLMRQGRIDACIVGADRIAKNGDVANKIGTYSVAVLAHRHGIPFYVAAPFSSVDLSLSTGASIPIEERSPQEVIAFRGTPCAPASVTVYNPAFDVTPGALVTAIITERGVAMAPHLSSELLALSEIEPSAETTPPPDKL